MSNGPALRPRQQIRREELFRRARFPDGENDGQRASAVHTLHRLYLRQCAMWRTIVDAATLAIEADEKGLLPPTSPPINPPLYGEPAAIIDRRLEDLFNGLGVRICRSKDPVEAAKKLFQPEKRRGPKIRNDQRDFDMAATIYHTAALQLKKELESSSKPRYSEDELETIRKKYLEDSKMDMAEKEGLSYSEARKIVAKQCAMHEELGLRAEAAFIEEQAEAADKAKGLASKKSANQARTKFTK